MSELGKVIEELERLEKAATPGPWRAGRMDAKSYDGNGVGPYKNVYADDPRGGVHRPTGETLPYTVARGEGDECLVNAAIIALLRTHAPILIAAAKRVEQAEAEVGRLREAVDAWSRWGKRVLDEDVSDEATEVFEAMDALTPPPTANAGATTLEGAGGEVRAESGSCLAVVRRRGESVERGWMVDRKNVEDRLDAIAETIDPPMRTVLVDAADIMRSLRALLAESITPGVFGEWCVVKDPAFGDDLDQLCRRCGYGAVLHHVAYLWSERTKQLGIAGSEHTVAACASVRRGYIDRVKAAIEEATECE